MLDSYKSKECHGEGGRNPRGQKPVQASLLRTNQALSYHWLLSPRGLPPTRASSRAGGLWLWEAGHPRDQAGSRWPGVGDQGDLATARPGARGSNFSMRSGSLGEGGHQGSGAAVPSTAPPRDPSALASVGHKGRREGDVWPTGGRKLTPGPRAFGLPEGGTLGSSPFCARLDASTHC